MLDMYAEILQLQVFSLYKHWHDSKSPKSYDCDNNSWIMNLVTKIANNSL